jgi:hypothetical protein
MLALAIISTVILGILIVLIFREFTDEDSIELILGSGLIIISFIFIIMTIWILYAR